MSAQVSKAAPTDKQIRAMSEAARIVLARNRLLDFSGRLYPNFDAAPHLRMLAELLERVERGEIKRLIFTVHPGSGKSTLLQLFASWFIGRNPRRKVIEVSAGAELAERNSRAARGFFGEDAWPFDAKISSESAAMHRWSTTAGGGMFAIGAEGVVTGWRADLIIADDLMNSAGTAAERESLWAWFREVLTPRLEQHGAIVVVMTRWCEDDIPGRLLDAPDGKEWHLVRLPALAEEDDPLGRKPGEALWPGRFNVGALQQRKIAMGSRAFETQFQGRPVPLEGNLIKASWFPRYEAMPEPQSFKKVVMALDAAVKMGVSNDYTAVAIIGVTESEFYLLDVVRKKVEFPELLRMCVSVKEQWGASAVYVEDASSGQALIQTLKTQSHLPIIPVKANASKIARVEGVTGTLEAGKVRLPKEAPWLLEFERELFAFPGGKHDDMVDAFVMGLSQNIVKKFYGAFLVGGADEATNYGSIGGGMAALMRLGRY